MKGAEVPKIEVSASRGTYGASVAQMYTREVVYLNHLAGHEIGYVPREVVVERRSFLRHLGAKMIVALRSPRESRVVNFLIRTPRGNASRCGVFGPNFGSKNAIYPLWADKSNLYATHTDLASGALILKIPQICTLRVQICVKSLRLRRLFAKDFVSLRETKFLMPQGFALRHSIFRTLHEKFGS